MCLCYLFSAKTARQLVNRKADFLQTNRFESIRITNRIDSIRIANWNALVTGIHCESVRSQDSWLTVWQWRSLIFYDFCSHSNMSVRLRAYLKTHKSKLRQIADACCLLSCDRGSVLFWRRCSSVATGRGGTCPPTPVWPGHGIGIAEIHGEKMEGVGEVGVPDHLGQASWWTMS